MLAALRPMGAFGLGYQRGLGQTAPSPLVSSIASAIVQMEGYNPNFAGNNNPGNIVYIGPNQNGQTGVTPGAGGFAQFTSSASGQQALYNQIQTQINSGQNLTQFFNQYAPGGTTNAAGGVQTSAATQNYINTVAQQTGIDPSTPLNTLQTSYSGSGSVPPLPTDSDTDSDSFLSSVTDSLSSIDFTDPTTIGVTVAAAALLLYALA